jgi:hypothetical protein
MLALFPLSYESNQTRGTNGICTHTAAVTMPDATFTTWSLEMVTRQGIEPCSPDWKPGTSPTMFTRVAAAGASHPSLRLFKSVLSCVSYTAIPKMVAMTRLARALLLGPN